jgi:HrpA-like RNA helicase
MRYFQNQLPTWQLKGQILAQIASHQVTLITGGTGCGKTTQVS